MRRTLTTILSFIISLCNLIYAQSGFTVRSGKVTDGANQPLEGVVVMLKGDTSKAAVTGPDGTYRITIPDNGDQLLEVSMMGYETLLVPADKNPVLNFVLKESRLNLDESVVIGYGSMKKSDLTGAVSSVSPDENEAARTASLDRLLDGRAAGVQVLSNSAAPDAGVNIRVRGVSTFNTDASPLFVVDGIIINGASESIAMFSRGTDAAGSDEQTNGLMGLNPQDIASVQILKDASATAIYGSQGANGVVLITTKSAKGDRMRVKFSAGVDVSTRNKKIDLLSFEEYVDYLKVLNESAPDKVAYDSIMSSLYENPETRTGLLVKPVDWQDYSFRTAVGHRYYFSLSGNPEKLSYSFSFGYNSKMGIVRNSGLEQYTARLNMDKEFGKVKIGTRTNFAFLKSDLVQGASTKRILSSASQMRSILMTRPWSSANDDEESDDYISGPDKWIRDFSSKREMIRVTPSIYLEWNILDWLTFKSTAGGDWSSTDLEKFRTLNISKADGNTGAYAHDDAVRFNFDNMFLFNKDAGHHHISGTLGVSMDMSSLSSHHLEGWDIEQYKAMENSLNSSGAAILQYAESRSSLLSVLARAIYNYRDRYVLTASVRGDGSSKFKGLNKWAVFPSFAFAWRMNQERWFNATSVSMLKLRVGWGQVGNQAISNYQTMTNYSSGALANHSNAAGYNVLFSPDNIANPDLRWETTSQTNVGLDLGMFSGRLSLTVDFYDKMTRDLLQKKNVARSTGFTYIWMNSGSIRNRGVDITIDAVPVATGNFEWSVGANISINRNRIISIGDSGERGTIFVAPGKDVEAGYFYGNSMSSGGSALNSINLFMEGMPMGLFYAFKTDGIVGEGETGPCFIQGEQYGPGHLKYVDVNGNGYIDDADRTIVGNPNPKFTFGFNTSFKYKHLTLSAVFTGSYGNDIFNLNNDREYYTSQGYYNVRKVAVTNAWSASNPSGRYPAIGMLEAADKSRFNDTNVEDGSHIRLSSLSLSWYIPLKNKILRALNLGVSAGNLFVATKYSGWDPDVNSYGSDLMRMGIDSNSYPQARSFSMDVSFNF